jgi:creatinine amidohydrolase
LNKVLYTELTPQEFRQKIEEAPIAYLPLGTLEWHGEHMPLGSDGIQSQGFFEELSKNVGGIVLPMLFLGPDRIKKLEQEELYGMDICDHALGHPHFYEDQQLSGSAYWVTDELFTAMLDSILKQLKRSGFKIVVAHGHGPSTNIFNNNITLWKEKYGLECFVCWGSEYDKDGMGLQVDHGAMNETSLVMALRPELVNMDNLSDDPNSWPVGIGGKDPREFASKELGEKIMKLQLERMEKILLEALRQL